jgi:hypothetical protein
MRQVPGIIANKSKRCCLVPLQKHSGTNPGNVRAVLAAAGWPSLSSWSWA